MIFHIIGITGTFEGWVPTATDLYLRGNNPAGLTNIDGSVEFQTGAIYLPSILSYIRCSKSYNFAPYSKLNFEINFTKVGSSGYAKELRLIKGTDKRGDVLASYSTSDIRSPGTYTLSINISALQLSTAFVLHIKTGTVTPGNNPSYVYHIWLS